MIGKVNDDFFQKSILTRTGYASDRLVIGPSMGVDAAILKTADGFMAIAEDPIFPSMTMSPENFAFVTVHIGASDVAVMGIKPEFMTYSLLLPPGTDEEYIANLIAAISREANKLGITIAGGHTGFYGAVTVPTIGGITVWGNGKHYISPQGAEAGDDIVITKGAGIEAAALLAYEFKSILKDDIVPEELDRAIARMCEISVVKDAGIAAANPGVHAMHDATEGGVRRGVWEIAQASGTGVEIDYEAIPVPKDISSICKHFSLSPWEIISEGTLILTCAHDCTAQLLASYEHAGIAAAVIGKVTTGGCVYHRDGKALPLLPPAKDKFWEVFFAEAAVLTGGYSSEKQDICRDLAAATDVLCQANIYKLLPEIGANIAYAQADSHTIAEIAGIPGRIIRAGDTAVAVGKPQLGASSHMGSCLLNIRKFFPQAVCLVDLRNNVAVREACETAKLKVVSMPVPAGYRQEGNDFIVDLDKVMAGSNALPDIVEIPDRINLERLILVIGISLDDLCHKILQLNTILAADNRDLRL